MIRNVYINDLSNSSIFVCGSVGCMKSNFMGRKEVLQSNEKPNEGDSEEKTLYKAFPVWLNTLDEDDEMEIMTDSSASVIRLDAIKVLSLSNGTAFHIGSSESIHLESRITEINLGNNPDDH
ncbi:spore germination protein GerPE [Paenibacillus wynnii]|uniref:spore germination protein GerPE n=1 Tax=Paenibacillus wynnii TaxID=268407 RepID=UPI00278D179F|nr:spore germination protein GerPE [Paenibacillus wynnii]MDQ0194290.1 spore germination protein PE [Paenibacillus wynnii]